MNIHIHAYICIYIYIYIYICLFIYIHTYIYLYTFTCIYVYIYVHMYKHIHTRIYVYICIRNGAIHEGLELLERTSIYIHIYIFVYVYVYIYIYVYIYTHVCTYMYVCMYVCMYICAHLQIQYSQSICMTNRVWNSTTSNWYGLILMFVEFFVPILKRYSDKNAVCGFLGAVKVYIEVIVYGSGTEWRRCIRCLKL